MRVYCPVCRSLLKRRNAGKHLLVCAERNRCDVCSFQERREGLCPRDWHTHISDLYRANPSFAECPSAQDWQRSIG